MSRVPRILRNLDLEIQDKEPIEAVQEIFPDNEEDNSQMPPDIDNILARMPRQSSEPITVICMFPIFSCMLKYDAKSCNCLNAGPNGEKRNIVGAFGISNLLELEGGKVMVGTDENGVPNERSASILGQHLGYLAESPTFAPLHIPRWDNELFKAHKEQIIKDVEVKII